jgi:hypothetical protein
MADNMQDLFTALQMFSSGMQQAATTKAVDEASIQMQDINKNIQDEAQKRVQLQDLGNQLALRLTGTGANAAQVEQAFKAVAPTNFGSVEQLQLEGQLSGNKGQQQIASTIISDRQKRDQEKMLLQNQLEIKRDERKLQNEYAIAQLKAKGQNRAAPGFQFAPGTIPTDKDIEDLKGASANYLGISDDLNRLNSMVKEHGTELFTVPGVGGQTKGEMESLNQSISLQLKEFEKLGVLNGQDLVVLNKIVPDPTGLSTEKYFKKAQTFKEILDARLKNRATSRGAVWLGSEGHAQDMQAGVQVKRLKDGRTVKVRPLPNGQFQLVD